MQELRAAVRALVGHQHGSIVLGEAAEHGGPSYAQTLAQDLLAEPGLEPYLVEPFSGRALISIYKVCPRPPVSSQRSPFPHLSSKNASANFS